MEYNLPNIQTFCDSWQNRKYCLKQWEKTIDNFSKELRKSALEIKESAPKANIIKVLNLGYDEVRHSRMLAWLLDKNETHNQDTLFFEHFLFLLGLEDKNYHTHQYEVARERPDRIDLSLFCRNHFCIFIENKVRHYERENQLYDEYCSLQKWAKNWSIPPENSHLVFLTPDGKAPESMGCYTDESINISWVDVANRIKKAALSELCYSDYIKRLSINYSDQIKEHAKSLIKED